MSVAVLTPVTPPVRFCDWIKKGTAMGRIDREVLISGASVAGPVLAWWLCQYGFAPTVVERTPEHRRGSGGHAVDLFEPAVAVVDRMGLLPSITQARTRTDLITLERPGRRPVDVDFSTITSWISDGRHVEIMRGELAEILYEATRDNVEYRFGDSIRTLDEDADGVGVTFEHGAPRRFGLVVGADGLHSTVRALTFGAESRFSRHLGGYLAAFTLPNHRGLTSRMVVHNGVNRMIGMYPVWQTGQARAVFLFRRAEELQFDHRDVEQQKRLLHNEFAGVGWEVPRLLAAAERADDFYLDSICQIRMDTWSRGRVTLVGDAGYSPGPAVGGGTTLAAVGAYVLAGALAEADGDHRVAFPAYEQEIGDYVARTRDLGPSVMKTLVPRSRLENAMFTLLARTVPRLPAGIQRRLAATQAGPARQMASFPLREPQAGGSR